MRKLELEDNTQTVIIPTGELVLRSEWPTRSGAWAGAQLSGTVDAARFDSHRPVSGCAPCSEDFTLCLHTKSPPPGPGCKSMGMLKLDSFIVWTES